MVVVVISLPEAPRMAGIALFWGMHGTHDYDR